MGLFDIFKKKEKSTTTSSIHSQPTTVIPEAEKKYYQPDSYYTEKTHPGTPFERTVITFEARKKTCIPSRTGLYVAEILLLEYCSYGKYPDPKSGYPGFWWFEYGIRDVGAALITLEQRGYIKNGITENTLKGLTIPEIKDLLQTHELPITGKKADLVARAITIDESALIAFGLAPKYELTELGQNELNENAYVPYMHKHSRKTNDSAGASLEFSVWSINRLLGNGDKTNWRSIADKEEARVFGEIKKNNDAFMQQLSKCDPDSFSELKAQDDQLELIQQTESQLSNDLNALITFWEKIWQSKGLLFEGSGWHFRLPDLYIQAQRYEDAIAFCEMIKAKKPTYADKADSYISKIEAKLKK